MGDRHLRKLLVLGATSGLGRARRARDPMARWTQSLTQRRAPRLVSVALANKMARIVWAVMAHGEIYRPEAAAWRRAHQGRDDTTQHRRKGEGDDGERTTPEIGKFRHLPRAQSASG